MAYLDCFLKTEKISQVHEISNFFVKNELLKYEGIILTLSESLLQNNKLSEIKKVLLSYSKFHSLEHQFLFRVIFNLRFLNTEFVEFLHQNNILWKIYFEDVNSDLEKLNLYYNIKTSTGNNNFGLIGEINNLNYLDSFNSYYSIGYGYPVTIHGESSCKNDDKINSEYIDFLNFLEDKILSFDFGFPESFFRGDSVLGVLIRKYALNGNFIRKPSLNKYEPHINENGQIFYNQFFQNDVGNIGCIQDGINYSKVHEIEDYLSKKYEETPWLLFGLQEKTYTKLCSVIKEFCKKIEKNNKREVEYLLR